MEYTNDINSSKRHFQVDADYLHWMEEVKQRLKNMQIKAAVRVNSTLLEFYWSLGKDMAKIKAEQKWGSGVIEQMSLDLKSAFPNLTGFSTTNLWYIKKWFLFYADAKLHQLGGEFQSADIEGNEKLPQLVEKFKMPEKFGLVPWRHHIEIITHCQSVGEALFYIQKTIDNGWSRSVLENNISSGLFAKQGKAITNFKTTLPARQSQLAQELLKDPYNFDFLTLADDYKERELEDALARNISRFLLELGKGFSYVGRQVELRVDDESFFIDMLFYHIRLKCYVVVELKTVKFIPEFAGKLNFYVTAVDRLLKQDDDKPTIGLLICKTKKDTLVEWALADIHKPIGVAGYELHNILPKELISSLPTPQELEKQLKLIDYE
ncbi:MAG: DUF1016 family protein [Prevotella sp.]|nr:DUF1016 family protein [Prevotella sp.]